MGIVNDLKKIFFGASSLAKSAAEKTGEFVIEEGAEILDKGKDLASKAGETVMEKGSDIGGSVMDRAGDIGGTVMDKAGDILSTGKEKLSEVANELSENPMVQSATEKVEDLGSKVLEKGKEFGGKFGEVSENVGEKVINTGGDLAAAGADVSERVGSKVLDAKDKLVERAGEISDKISNKMDETMAKAEAWEAEEAKKPKREFAEDDLNADGSLLEGTDDFFSKADKFASGDYDAVNEGKVSVMDDPAELQLDPLPSSPVAGFDDADNDGNPLIDDATILDEDEPKDS